MAVVWEWLSCQKVIKLTPAHHEALPALKDWSYGLADRGPAWQWQPGDIRPVIPRQQGQSPWAMAEGAVYFIEECPGGSWNVARGDTDGLDMMRPYSGHHWPFWWKWKWNCSVVSDSLPPHGLQPTRLLCPWGFPGKNRSRLPLPSPEDLPDSFEKTLMLGKTVAGRRRGRRGWDGWMASPTQWAWVWVNSRSLWWTGRPGLLRFMGSQRVGHDWATQLNWTNWTETF